MWASVVLDLNSNARDTLEMYRAGVVGAAFVFLSTLARGEGDAPAPYTPDMFEEREVEACAMAPIVGVFPIQGGPRLGT